MTPYARAFGTRRCLSIVQLATGMLADLTAEGGSRVSPSVSAKMGFSLWPATTPDADKKWLNAFRCRFGSPDMGVMRQMKTRTLMAGLAATAFIAPPALAQDCPVKVGVLHSLSGTMAISETTLKDTVLMLVEQQNEAGGLLGCDIEAVVVDPASDWPLFAEKARELLTVNEVDVIFGSWTSVSRKSALPVLEELNGLMFYPVQYEGEESS